MARVRKALVRPGNYLTPSGPVEVTVERMRHWLRQFRALKTAGFKPAMPWDHRPEALPESDQEAKFRRSRYNAGHVEDLEIADGQLWATLDGPGLEIDADGRLTSVADVNGQPVRTAIADVSLAAQDWRDGRGRLWPDAIVHVALTPTPVCAGQEPFQAVAMGMGHVPKGQVFLSLSQIEESMADDKKDKKADDDAAAGAYTMKDALAALAKVGMTLPEDTTEANLVERIIVASTAMAGQNGGEKTPPENDSAVTVETPPAVMSLSIELISDPTTKALMAREIDRRKADRMARINDLKSRGLSKPTADRLAAQAGAVQLSLANGKLADEPIDLQLSLLDETMPKTKLTGASTVQVQPNPATSDQQDQEAAGEEMAELVKKRRRVAAKA